MSDLKVMREIDRFLLDGNRELMEITRTCYHYTTHDQWDRTTRQELIDQKRPALEIDLTSNKVNILVGIESQFRGGVEVGPFESGDKPQAQIATFLLKSLNRNNRIDRQFSRVWKDVVICGRGFIDNHPKFSDDFMIECDPRRESPFRVRFDNGLEIDQSDWNYMARDRWMTNKQIKTLKPGIELSTLEPDMDEQSFMQAFVEDDLDYGEGAVWNYQDYVDLVHAKRRVVEIYERKHTLHDFILKIDTGDVFTLDKFLKNPDTLNEFSFVQVRNQTRYDPKDEKEVVEIMRGAGLQYALLTRPHKEIHMGLFAAGVEIDKMEKLPYDHNDFPIVAVFGYVGEREDGRLRASGIVEGLIGIQDEKNKARSEFLDILISAPRAAGWFQKDKGVTPEDLMDMHKSRMWVGVRGRIDETIKEREQVGLPILSQLAAYEQMSEQDATNTSGVNLPMAGISTSSRESGIAAQTRIQQGMLGVTEPLDHLDAARIRTYQQIITYIQQYYPPSKVRRVIGNADLEVGPQDIENFLSNYRFNRYDAVINKEQSPTARKWMLSTAMQLIQYGVPPELLLEEIVKLSDFPNPDNILRNFQQQKLLNATETSVSGP